MKFDVFVSFRGVDTRRTFGSHLLLSLFNKQIKTFKHEEETLTNQSHYFQVLQAIEESKIAIVVISKNYVASSWCLEELAMIFECKEIGLLEVVPVFYEVDPSDVLRQVDDLEDQGDGDENLEKVKKWKDALEKLIEIYHQKYSYWEGEDSYSYIIDEVLIHVSQCLSESKTVIEASEEEIRIEASEEETRIEAPYIRQEKYIVYGSSAAMPTFILILQFLCAIVFRGIELVAAAFRKIAALCTIAWRCMYGEDSSGVKHRPPRSFVDMLNDNQVIADNLSRFFPNRKNNLSRFILSNDSNRFVGMDRLMKEVYKLLNLESKDANLEISICGESGVGKTTLARCVYEQISPQFQDHQYFIKDTKNCSPGECLLDDIAKASLTEGSKSLDEVVKAKLGHRKVLLIVDNVFDSFHFGKIRNIARWFGPGSRLIFVTSVKSLLLSERLYVVEPLRYDEALQLFSHVAFKKKQIPREYYQLSVRGVTVTGRIPLALKVFGTFLRGKHISEWEHELCRLETSQSTWDCVAEVSSYIGRALSCRK